MGEILLAEDLTLDRKVALKLLPQSLKENPKVRERLLREAKSAAALDHPYICKVYEVGQSEGGDYIAMEYVEGETIEDNLANGPPPLTTVIRLASEIAEALEKAHDKGIVHRDLKPSNVMFTPDGHVKVLDFGLAKKVGPGEVLEITSGQTKKGSAVGTLPYMSPEQVRGETIDARSDIFSLGVTLYEMLTGVHPFRQDSPNDMANAILNQTPAPVSRYAEGTPESLQHTVDKMLAKDKDQRYQSIREVRRDLTRALELLSTPETGQHRAGSRRRGIRRIAFVAAAVFLAGIGWWQYRERVPSNGTGQISSIAVLPLENLSGEPDQEYFSDGMTEALITSLSQIRSLRVISRTSVMAFKGARKPLSDTAKELNVEVVLEGSVLRVADRVRITAQLTRASSDELLWAESYDRELNDVLALQDELARTIAERVQIKLTPQEEVRLGSAKEVNPEAYEAYLKGRYYWNKRTEPGLKRGIEYFAQAIESDPNYALAYTGLADSYLMLVRYQVLRPTEAFPNGEAAARKALAIDDGLGAAHTSLATILSDYYWDWQEADSEHRRAIELDPNYAAGHKEYSEFLGLLGRSGEAIRVGKRALELDPISVKALGTQGFAFYRSRQYDKAIDALGKALDMDPSMGPLQIALGLSYLLNGMYEEGISALQKQGDFTFPLEPYLGYGYGKAGNSEEAQKILDALQRQAAYRYVSPVFIALVHLGLGEYSRALDWLEKGYEERAWMMLTLKAEPVYDPLRSEPRFHEILKKMNLAD